MTADERLDQLEILLAESMAILDRHTAQLKQLNSSVNQLKSDVSQLKSDISQLKSDVELLSKSIIQQSDNISFLLREQAEMKIQQTEMNGKLDLIIGLLQRPGQ